MIKARDVKQDLPFDWLINNERLSDAIKISKESDLPDKINEYIKERSLDEESGCIQLLICKISPFIWAMQRTLNTKDEFKMKGEPALSQFMPNLEEVADNSDECEEKYPYCLIHY